MASVAMLLVAVCLVAANMRPAITGLGPLLDQIGADTGMSVAALGILAAVPLAAWAVFSPVAHNLGRRFGQPRVLLGSLLVLLVGTLVRSIPGPVASPGSAPPSSASASPSSTSSCPRWSSASSPATCAA
jgi:CP family cyanate transporter-like MFS transporter